MARLPFKGNMSFVIVMPHQMTWNVSNILDKLNRSELYSRLHREKPTSLKIPKLNLDFKLELRQALVNLGKYHVAHERVVARLVTSIR